MLRSVTVILTALSLLATTATARQFITAGSTIEGDYLRGMGIAAVGMGSYNFNSARAFRIEALTEIEVDNYWRTVVANENHARALNRAARRAHRIKLYSEIQDRILSNPTPADLRIGNAHNSLLEYLNAGSDTAMKLNPIILPTDLVRQLPYKLNKEAAVFSLPRLMHKTRVPWPVAFQESKFNKACIAYDRAMANAFDERLDGKLSSAAIDNVAKAIKELEVELNLYVSQSTGKLYNEGASHIRELKASYEDLKSLNIQRAIIDLDEYSGTTVYDLRKFMWGHDLKFAEPNTKEELDAYRVLYDALVAQRNITEFGKQEAK